MAVGDTVNEITSIANAAYLTIQPAGTAEWVIHNIYHEDAVEVYYYDGTNYLKFDSDTTFGYFTGNWHVTNAHYIAVKNVQGAAAKLIGYDGIITHV